ncbi:MAG: hypothetical protein AW09_000325 [Candidatus Accumulibacter phosphatis]|uniref:Uncharacterized protein n=1 Tax=Candidatus Accumulibacter phosphatis TaxID=327160 RepID=A0A080LZU3_9PROT|nr:MAG: hypothetical protein AW09_000325 [Candidatus Accumulibacter phosphatis]
MDAASHKFCDARRQGAEPVEVLVFKPSINVCFDELIWVGINRKDSFNPAKAKAIGKPAWVDGGRFWQPRDQMSDVGVAQAGLDDVTDGSEFPHARVDDIVHLDDALAVERQPIVAVPARKIVWTDFKFRKHVDETAFE